MGPWVDDQQWCAAWRPRAACRSRLAGRLRGSRTARSASRRVHHRDVATPLLAQCSKMLSNSAQHGMQQHRCGDPALLINAVEHDGKSLSDASISTVEDLVLTAVFNVKNEEVTRKMNWSMRPCPSTQRNGAAGRADRRL